MNREIDRQKCYWDAAASDFDAIYSHAKSWYGNLLDSIFRWDMYARFTYTLENSEPIRGRSFLDVGCGTGRYALELARRDAGRVVGLDISETMIRVCRQRARSEGLDDRTQFIQTDLPMYEAEGRFDVGIAIGLFDYLRTPLPVLRKMRECVQERVILSFPKFWTWRAPVRKVRLGVLGCDVRFYTETEIDRLIRSAGFKRYSFRELGELYCVTAQSV